MLRALEAAHAPAVRPVGLVERRTDDPHAECSAALITAYEPYSFSYRELLSGPGFGPRRNQMLDAFANLLVQVHLARCFWGDCSLSNVLYRFDAEASRLRVRVVVGSRRYHATRLRELMGIDALEQQARQILSDLYYHQATQGEETSAGKSVSAIRWRVGEFEPMLRRLSALDGVVDPIQAYCDLLHHRHLMSERTGSDVDTETAFADWMAAGRPGYEVG